MKYLTGIFIDILVTALFVTGAWLHLNGPVAAVHGFLWVAALACLVPLLSPAIQQKMTEIYSRHPPLWRVYDLFSDVGFIVLTARSGGDVLTVFLM
ncbi:TPA: hypothetical protein I8Y21_002312 [Klebsiella oxytoca]|uniref:Uncharacterized protein n=1 Tax=Klebsiella oxytoca TaxID=571 RepID=A0AAN5RDK0_KLEOX|nr:hypothetical protein [Klebsiella oxytoca]